MKGQKKLQERKNQGLQKKLLNKSAASTTIFDIAEPIIETPKGQFDRETYSGLPALLRDWGVQGRRSGTQVAQGAFRSRFLEHKCKAK